MRTFKLHFSFLFLFVLIFAGANSQTDYSNEVLDNISKVEQNIVARGNTHWNLQQRMAYYNVKGLSIAVIHNYKIEWAKGYGLADESENRPVTEETLFQAASISKSINGVGVMKLVQEKKIRLDEDINNYLVSWKFPYRSSKDKITVANLLNHSAGLSVHGFPGYEKTDHLPNLVDILNGSGDALTEPVRSEFSPGTKYQYSGGGTTISQAIVSDVTQKPYDQFMWENVLKPLGMNNSFFTQPAPENKKNLLATAYNNGVPVKGKYHIYPEQAAAGLWTNPTDLAKYIIETQLALKGNSNKVLDQETTVKYLTPRIANSGMGVFLEKRGDATYFYHSGVNEGFGAYYYGSLENGNGVVVMINSDFCPLLSEIINCVGQVYNWPGFTKGETALR